MVFAWPARGEPEPATGVIYELLPESEVLLQCFVCELFDPVVPLAGRFLLGDGKPVAGGIEYALLDVEFRAREAKRGIRVTGSGTYLRGERTQSLVLNLMLNEGPEAQYTGGGGIGAAPAWPGIALQASTVAPGQAVFIDEIRIAAAPRPKLELVPYRLESSYLLVDCNLCKRQSFPIYLEGTFLLGLVPSAGPLMSYRVECVDFRSEAEPLLSISGYGGYLRIEEFSLEDSMTLDVRLAAAGEEEIGGIVLESGLKPRAVPFPAIKLDLVQQNPRDQDTIFKIHLEAEPDVPPPGDKFRRGDANDDGLVDISDPVQEISWLFQGGGAPGCLETADTNRDRQHDLTDVVFLLAYLFLAGEPPPTPGPQDCGSDPEPGPGCAIYRSCAP
jgi:hypothetical protein